MNYIAQLDNYYLDIINTTDNFIFSIAQHEYPHSNKNKLENLGEKTRKVKIKCVFLANPTETQGWGPPNIEPTYEAHYDFIDHIQTHSSFTLIHPKYGTLKGKITTITVVNDDTIEYCTVDFEFLVEIDVAVSYLKPIEAQQAQAFASTSAATEADISTASQISKNLVRWEGLTQQYINRFDSYLQNITSPATSIVSTIYYASTIEAQLLRSINYAVDRAIQPIIATDTITRLASQATISNMVAATNQMTSFFYDQYGPSIELDYCIVLIATRVSYESSVLYELDNDASIIQAKNELAKPFDSNGNFHGMVLYKEVMTINELDKTCYEVKTLIDNAVKVNRERLDLKAQGALLQKYVNQVKLDRERIVTQLETPLQSLHNIALSNNLSYNKAEQLLKLNPDITNPTFAVGAIKVLTQTESV